MHTKLVKLAQGKLVGGLRHDGKAKQLIVICHGYQASRNHPAILAIAEKLSQKGYATFTFDFSKEGDGTDVKGQVEDITRIAKHFKDYDEIILLGMSFGALSVSIAASQLSNLTGLITLNGFFGSLKLGHEHRRAFIGFRILSLISPRYRKLWKYFKQELQPAHIEAPVLVIHSEADQTVYIAQSRWFFKRVIAPKRFKTLKTADHGLTSNKDIDTVVAWIDEWLG